MRYKLVVCRLLRGDKQPNTCHRWKINILVDSKNRSVFEKKAFGDLVFTSLINGWVSWDRIHNNSFYLTL